MTYKAIKMDYPYDALEPFMPAEFLQMHYEKHHIGYQNKLQSIIEGTEYEDMFENTIDLLKNYQKIEDPILKTKIRELAGGVANHDFFWKSMKLGTELKDEDLISEIERTWGSFENFKKDFMDISMSVFGSGWVYLVKRPNGELKFIKLFNQDNPWFLKFTPLFAVDLWEHSYYLEYKWDRARYLEEFWKVINWDFVSEEYNK